MKQCRLGHVYHRSEAVDGECPVCYKREMVHPYPRRHDIFAEQRKIRERRGLKENPASEICHVNINGRKVQGTVIYDRVFAIEAKKGSESNFPKESFRHDFTDPSTIAVGLEDGSVLIVNTKGKRLWKEIDY